MHSRLKHSATLFLIVFLLLSFLVFVRFVPIVHASTLTINTAGAGDLTNIPFFTGAATHWQTQLTDDSDTSYVYSSDEDTTYYEDLYNMSSTSGIPSSSTIDAVEVHCVIRSTSASYKASFKAQMKNGTDYATALSQPSTTYVDTAVNYTGVTYAALATMQIGVNLKSGKYLTVYYPARSTQVYAVIYYSLETTPPTYDSVSTNTTGQGQPCSFNVNMSDNIGLNPNGQYIFGTDNTGSWVNDTAANFTATPQWGNVTSHTLNDTIGLVIHYEWWFTDNAGNKNNTGQQSLTVTPATYKYVTQQSDIDGVADIGAHSSFNAQKATDTTYDNITAGVSSPESYVYCNNNGGVWTNPTYAYNNDTANGASYATTGWTPYLVLNLSSSASGTIIRYYVGRSTIDVTTMEIYAANQSGSWTNIFSATPTYGAYTNTTAFSSSNYTAIEFRFNIGFSATAYVNEVQAVTAPLYALSLEEQWINVYYANATELDIRMGPTPAMSTTLYIQFWNSSGSTWVTLSTITTSTTVVWWNNFTISSYLNSSTFTIRFLALSSTTNNFWYVDCALIRTFTLTSLYSWLTTFASSVNWEESMDTLYVGYLMGTVTLTQLQNGIASLTSWRDVLVWSARTHKYGIDNQTKIQWALDNATMLSDGSLPSSTDYGNSSDYYLIHYREFLWGYYWANLYNYELSKWNLTTAYNNFRAAWQWMGHGFLYYFNSSYATGLGPRYYDECGETIAVFLQMYEFNVTAALADAETEWEYVNTYHWNAANDYYQYTNASELWECEAGGFLEIAAWLRYCDQNMNYTDRLFTDFNNRFIINDWFSPQWLDISGDVPESTYVVIHAYPSNVERRLPNTIMAWASILGTFPLFDDTTKQGISNLLSGFDGYYPAWYLLTSSNANLYNSTTNQFKATSDGISWNEWTAYGMALMLIQGICPINATIAVPVEELHYEYLCNILDHDLISIDFNSRTLTLGIGETGTVRFLYGSPSVDVAFAEQGMYNVTFSEYWNSTSSVTYLTSLPSNRKYLFTVLGNTFTLPLTHAINSSWSTVVSWGTKIGLSQSITYTCIVSSLIGFSLVLAQAITASWATLVTWGANMLLSQSISSSWSTLALQGFPISLSQSVSSAWSIVTGWFANVGLSQAVSMSWATTIQWVANVGLSQPVTSVWSVSAGITFILALTQGITTSWATFASWSASIGLTQTLSTSWNSAIEWLSNIGLAQSISSTWTGSTNWVANIGLSQSITTGWSVLIQQSFLVGLNQSIISGWSVLAGWIANVNLAQSISSVWSMIADLYHLGTWTADLTQTISISWSVITAWSANIGLTQGISTVWSVTTQTAYYIATSFAIGTTWNVTAVWVSIHDFILNLTQGITISWMTPSLTVIIPTSNLPLMLGAFAVVMTFVLFALVIDTQRRTKPKTQESL